MLLAAQEFGCVYQACLVAALTQGRDLLIRNPGKEVANVREDLFGAADRGTTSDFLVLMRAWEYAASNQFRMELCEAPAFTVSRRVKWVRFTNSFSNRKTGRP